jgi:hypothetical protein
VEATAPVVLTHGWPDPLSHFPFAMDGQDESTISRNKIKIAAEG